MELGQWEGGMKTGSQTDGRARLSGLQEREVCVESLPALWKLMNDSTR